MTGVQTCALPIYFIIHTVAPKWFEEQKNDKEKLLRKCYENSISLASDFNCRRVAFPCLGMGVYGCPIEIGGKIAIDFAVEETRKVKPRAQVIYLVCYTKEQYEFYMEYLKKKIAEK